jgi:hypothetical protein
MARTARSLLSASRLLTVLSGLLVVLAFLPAGAIRWVGELSRPLVVVLAPMQDVLGSGVKLVAGEKGRNLQETPEVADLRQKAEEYKTLWLGEREENKRLVKQIEELQKWPMSLELVRPVYAPIIGPGMDLSPGLLKAKAGEREGVFANSVVVVEGAQLVGRVTKVEWRHCVVLPITQKASGALKGVVMLPNGERGPICDLSPTGGGTLRGRVLGEDAAALRSLVAGMEVRLDDPLWPASARMLVIGEIEEVTPLPQLPTRPVVTVKPRFRVDAISEVVIRVPTEAEKASGGGNSGGPP